MIITSFLTSYRNTYWGTKPFCGRYNIQFDSDLCNLTPILLDSNNITAIGGSFGDLDSLIFVV